MTTTTEAPLERALKTARDVSSNELERMLARARAAEAEIDNLLPLERGQLADLRKIASESATKVKVLSAMRAANERYAELSTEAFGYRDDSKLPLLMPFSLYDREVWISNHGFSVSFPKAVTELYKDVQTHLVATLRTHNAPIRKRQNIMAPSCGLGVVVPWSSIVLLSPWNLGDKVLTLGPANAFLFVLGVLFGLFADKLMGKKWFGSQEVSGYRVCTHFDGLIPEPIRQKIRTARSLGVFSEIFILAEVPGLKIEETPRLARVGDPLVIGYDGSNFWLIAAFDTTPVEAMAMTAPIVKT